MRAIALLTVLVLVVSQAAAQAPPALPFGGGLDIAGEKPAGDLGLPKLDTDAEGTTPATAGTTAQSNGEDTSPPPSGETSQPDEHGTTPDPSGTTAQSNGDDTTPTPSSTTVQPDTNEETTPAPSGATAQPETEDTTPAPSHTTAQPESSEETTPALFVTTAQPDGEDTTPGPSGTTAQPVAATTLRAIITGRPVVTTENVETTDEAISSAGRFRSFLVYKPRLSYLKLCFVSFVGDKVSLFPQTPSRTLACYNS